ncbi:MAG: Hint domain-containing protein, partial [Loktanella sp.]|nr:Hint domain-containing protein [Loktanella sp.]
QRQDRLGAGRSEVLVKVRHLINGDTVYQRDGGFVDYFQLLFDDHQIIYAEGIAAESLLIDPRTRAALPDHMRSGETRRSSHGHRAHLDYEVQEKLLSQKDAIGLLRKASST